MFYLEELVNLENRLKTLIASFNSSTTYTQIGKILDRAREVGLSFSGSWIGYHAYVYYSGLTTPPPHAIFSSEWGLMSTYSRNYGSSGDWIIYTPTQIKDFILDDVYPVRSFFILLSMAELLCKILRLEIR